MELSLTSGPVAAKGGISPLTGYERWVADVAYLSPDRLAAVDPDDNVCGAPDLVIEVLSPSNTVAEMNDRERICLENGAQEFGSVDSKNRQVKISTPDGRTITWRSDQEIPSPLFGDARVAVDAIAALSKELTPSY
jgi:Uma2 family endonuclease